MRGRIGSGLLLLMLAGTAISLRAQSTPQRVIMPPAAMMEAAWPTLDGSRRQLRDFHGKVLVVDLWATWCGPCRIEIPHLTALASELNSKGVRVVGLTTEDPVADLDRVRRFAGEFKINYPIGFASGELSSYLFQGAGTIPQTYVFARDGRLIRRFIGFNPQTTPAQLRIAVDEALSIK